MNTLFALPATWSFEPVEVEVLVAGKALERVGYDVTVNELLKDDSHLIVFLFAESTERQPDF